VADRGGIFAISRTNSESMSELSDKLKVVAIYDGWEQADKPDYYIKPNWDISHRMYIYNIEYNTSFDWLIPVAKKVYDALIVVDSAYADMAIRNRAFELFTPLHEVATWQDISLLFPAVGEAIEFLNTLK